MHKTLIYLILLFGLLSCSTYESIDMEKDGKEAISETLRSNRLKFRSCYHKQIDHDKPMDYQMKVEFTIQVDGHVKNVKLAENTPEPLKSCFTEKLLAVKFPPIKGDNAKDLEILQGFNLYLP